MGGLYIPYDGKSIGAYISDTIRDIKGHMSDCFAGNLSPSNTSGAFEYVQTSPRQDVPYQAAYSSAYGYFNFYASRVVPTSYENRPVSISAMTCITF
jgi:hypothetical protein